ncbi:MAG TPA: hypothetical protein VMR81_04950 [Patescibacteria group bacterium]|nr:hypothetical protein [Patescibacteria group bacterium]
MTPFETILKTSFVKADVHRRIRVLRQFLEQKYYGRGEKLNLKEFLDKEKVSDTDKTVLAGWGPEILEGITKENAYDLTDAMTDEIKELPLITLYIPFEPDEASIQRIGTWFRENVDKRTLVDINVEASVFGGCAFAQDGVYHDYSLRGLLSRHYQEIRTVFDQYAKQL